MTQPTAQKMGALITAGLYETNVSQLLALARESFLQSPALYGTLIGAFKTLMDEFEEYGGQWLPADCYDGIVQGLTAPLLDALHPEEASPAQLLQN